MKIDIIFSKVYLTLKSESGTPHAMRMRTLAVQLIKFADNPRLNLWTVVDPLFSWNCVEDVGRGFLRREQRYVQQRQLRVRV